MEYVTKIESAASAKQYMEQLPDWWRVAAAWILARSVLHKWEAYALADKRPRRALKAVQVWLRRNEAGGAGGSYHAIDTATNGAYGAAYEAACEATNPAIPVCAAYATYDACGATSATMSNNTPNAVHYAAHCAALTAAANSGGGMTAADVFGDWHHVRRILTRFEAWRVYRGPLARNGRGTKCRT